MAMTKKNTVNQQRQKVVHRPAQDDRRRHLSPRKSARSRKVRLWLLYGFLILAVLGVALALSLTVLFKIDTITVEGETRYDSAQVIELSGIEQGQNLFLCKAKEGAASIENALPYVETVEISRRIPNKIVITVKEATPSGVISQQDGYVIISSQGKVLEVADQPKEDLPIIKGIQLENAQPGSSVQFEDQNAQEVLQSITQAIERNVFAPAIKEQPRHRYDAPPREVAKDDLQVDEQLADLHIEVCDVEAQHKIEVVRKEAHNDACKVEMEHPQDHPAHPYRFML